MTMIYPRDGISAHPPNNSPAYKSSSLRAPTRPLIIIPHTLSETTGPVYGHEALRAHDGDLTLQQAVHACLDQLSSRVVIVIV